MFELFLYFLILNCCIVVLWECFVMLELVFLTFYEFKFNVWYILNKILVNYIIKKNKCGETEWVLMDAH